jgi:hypothetical protein
VTVDSGVSPPKIPILLYNNDPIYIDHSFISVLLSTSKLIY